MRIETYAAQIGVPLLDFLDLGKFYGKALEKDGQPEDFFFANCFCLCAKGSRRPPITLDERSDLVLKIEDQWSIHDIAFSVGSAKDGLDLIAEDDLQII
tara:strand:- start:2569 stop:2865 length:297 start_codon:yes stop_codon:yes gene_type:complete